MAHTHSDPLIFGRTNRNVEEKVSIPKVLLLLMCAFVMQLGPP